MAREYLRMHLSVWDDPDFIRLTALEQTTYWAVAGSRDLTYAGVAPLLPGRFVRAADSNPTRVGKAITRLAKARFLLVDEMTGEVAVRTYIRHDGVLKQYNVVKSMCRAFARIHSDTIRDALEIEVMRGIGELYPERVPQVIAKSFIGEFAEGFSEGFRQGFCEGFCEPLAEGLTEGLTEPLTEGLTEPLAEGLAEGLTEPLIELLPEPLAEGLALGVRNSPSPFPLTNSSKHASLSYLSREAVTMHA